MHTLIVNPNPIFDRTITIVELVPGAVIRALDVELTAGGKGVNVARVLRALGRPAPMVIPVGADDRARYESLLAGEGAEFNVVEVPGGVRTASIYLEERSNRVTVVNDAGTEMAMSEWARVRDAVRGRVTSGDLVLCMGSFLLGCRCRHSASSSMMSMLRVGRFSLTAPRNGLPPRSLIALTSSPQTSTRPRQRLKARPPTS